MNETPHALSPRDSRGFSLVEILVGVVIGMLGLLVIFKTISVWDSQTRTTTAGGDSQVAGTLAIFNLERDIKQAGMGFGRAQSTVMGCNVAGEDTETGRTLAFPMFPVQIAASGPTGSPDTISVLSGNSSFFATEQAITGSTATTKKLPRRDGFRNGDVALVAGNPTALPGSATCVLVQVTDNTDPDGFTLTHAQGAYLPDAAYAAASGASAAARFNAAAGAGATFTSGYMYSLGPNPQRNVWQTNGRVLSRVEYLHGDTAFEIAEGVVNMRAEYGVDADNDGIIADTEWQRTTPTDWTKVRAVRVGVLVRSSQFEKPATATAVAVTASSPSWAGGTFLMTNIDGSSDSFTASQADPNNWRYYRYRVYEKVIPLRNMIWGTAP